MPGSGPAGGLLFLLQFSFQWYLSPLCFPPIPVSTMIDMHLTFRRKENLFCLSPAYLIPTVFDFTPFLTQDA